MAFVKIIELSPCMIPNNSLLKRDEIRSIKDQQLNYKSKYDYKTLCYDVFKKGNNIIFSGPPLYGLENLLNEGDFFLDNKKIPNEKISTKLLNRLQKNTVHLNNFENHSKFKWKYSDIMQEVLIREEFTSLFENKKVLLSKSKDNEMYWIEDWIHYYIYNHNIDSVLLYDNNSNKYSINELKTYLETKFSDKITIILIPWNFPYGPAGGFQKDLDKEVPWDSDFCQYGIMEHAKERFLSKAYGVINVDIDELIITPKNTNIFDYLKKNKGVIFNGKWIENIPCQKLNERRFFNFIFYDKKSYKANPKWCISPQQINSDLQWYIHSVEEPKLLKSKKIYHAHFKAINTSWQFDRSEISFKPKVHKIDKELKNILLSTFNKPIHSEEKKPKVNFFKKILGSFF